MKNFLLAAVCAAAAIAAVSPADAAGHCGLAKHRGPHGGCRVNANGALIASTPHGNVRVGSFYAGRGYWDGHRYWAHRYAWRGGWRYRDGPIAVAPGINIRIGSYYAGRGYWDGHRYWAHRDRDDRGGWRYR